MTIEENLGLAYSRGKRRSLTIGIRKKDVSVFRERLKELDLGLEDRMKMPVGLLRRTATGAHIAYGDYRYTKASAS